MLNRGTFGKGRLQSLASRDNERIYVDSPKHMDCLLPDSAHAEGDSSKAALRLLASFIFAFFSFV